MKKSEKKIERPIMIKETTINDVVNEKILEIKKQLVWSEEEKKVYAQVIITTEDEQKRKHWVFIISDNKNDMEITTVKKPETMKEIKEMKKIVSRR